METPILKTSRDVQFDKEHIKIQNDLCLKDCCFDTLKHIYDIKLPKFFIQDRDKENNNTNNINNDNIIIEVNDDNHINNNEIKKTSQENEDNSSITNEINVSVNILK